MVVARGARRPTPVAGNPPTGSVAYCTNLHLLVVAHFAVGPLTPGEASSASTNVANAWAAALSPTPADACTTFTTSANSLATSAARSCSQLFGGVLLSLHGPSRVLQPLRQGPHMIR